LPLLAFGEQQAEKSSGTDEVARMLFRTFPFLEDFEPAGAVPQRQKLSYRRIGTLPAVGISSTACRMIAGESPGCFLLMPSVGRAELTCESGRAVAKAGEAALLLPNICRTIDATRRSFVVLAISPERLATTRSVMTGLDPIRCFHAEAIHELRFEGRSGCFAVFHHLCHMLGDIPDCHLADDPLGLSDMFYRWICSLLIPDCTASERIGHVRAQRLDSLCDQMRMAFLRPMSLTEMEEASGLSSRALQYAFRSRFGCSPTEWQRRERLLLARTMLLEAGPDVSITAFAYRMGFSSSASFAALYRRYFSETPSHTLRRLRS